MSIGKNTDDIPQRYLPVSIVTPSYNQVDFIGEAIKSVQMQGDRSCEHLIIDGFSTDGTVEMLGNLDVVASKTNVRWFSERDSGQSAALNKGFSLANGKIIGWLNSDDSYKEGCFDQVFKSFDENPDVDVIYGNYELIDESGSVIQVRREIEFSKFVLLYHRVLYIATIATFFRRRVFDENNWIDESLHYAMDLDLLLRLAQKGYVFKHVNYTFAQYRLQPLSKTCSRPEMFRLEHDKVIYTLISASSESKLFMRLSIMFGRPVAALVRYLEKLLRGYYWSMAD